MNQDKPVEPLGQLLIGPRQAAQLHQGLEVDGVKPAVLWQP